MKLPRLGKKRARIEIIPMIDTMFFLLVFFMIATLSMTMQQGINVHLPEAQTSTDTADETLTVTLTDPGKVFFNKLPTTIEELGGKLQASLTKGISPTVVINADQSIHHGLVVQVMDVARRAGITDVAIATRPSASVH